MKRISSGWTTGLTTALRLTHTQSTCIYTHSPGAALISAFLQLESNRYQCVFFPVYSLLVIIPSSLKAHNDPFQWGAKEATAKKITPAFFQASREPFLRLSQFSGRIGTEFILGEGVENGDWGFGASPSEALSIPPLMGWRMCLGVSMTTSLHAGIYHGNIAKES